MPVLKGPTIVGTSVTVSAGNSLVTVDNYGAPSEPPTLTELGTYRDGRPQNGDPITETVNVGAAGTNKKLILEIAWNSESNGQEPSNIIPSIDGVNMDNYGEARAGIRCNASIFAGDVTSGNVALSIDQAPLTTMNTYSYRLWTVEGDYTLDTVGSASSTGNIVNDFSAIVKDTSEIVGCIMSNNDGNAGYSYAGLTQDHNVPGLGVRNSAHWSYSPSADEDPRTMTVQAPSGTGEVAAINLVINPLGAVPQTPVITNPSLTVPENSQGSIDVTLPPVAVDPQGQELTCIAATPDTGTATFADGKTIIYTPPADYSGPAEIDFSVQDPDGNTANGTVFVTVADIADHETNNNRATVMEDPQGFTITSIDTPPPRGQVTLVEGNIWVDMAGETDTSDMSITYTRDNGGAEQVVKTIRPSQVWYERGDHPGLFWRPELDSNGAAVIEPAESCRYVHCAAAGLDAAGIVTLEPSLTDPSQVTGAWLRDNPADGGGGAYYGETEALAINQELAENLVNTLEQSGDDFDGLALLFNRGDTFVGWRAYVSNASLRRTGDSVLHPNIVGAYGTGAKPRFGNGGPTERNGQLPKLFSGSHWIYTSLDTGGSRSVDSTSSFVAFVDIKGDYQANLGTGNGAQIDCGGNGDLIEYFTVLNCQLDNCWGLDPSNGTFWRGQQDTASALHAGKTAKVLVENVASFNSGHGLYYRRDADAAHDKTPETFAHGIYFSGAMLDVTVRNTLHYHCGGTWMQMRCGALMERTFGMGNQSGLTLGTGPLDRRKYRWEYENPGAPYTGDDFGRFGNYSACIYSVQTHGGWKGHNNDSSWNKVAVGNHTVGAGGQAMTGSLVLNRGAPFQELTTDLSIGPGMPTGYNADEGAAFSIKSQNTDLTGDPGMVPSVLARTECMVGGWGPNAPEQGVSHVDQAVRDALTIQGWTDARLSTTGSSYIDFSDHMITVADQWDSELPSLLNYFLTDFGVELPSARSGQTVKLVGINGAPWDRADVWANWDTRDLPGTEAGDTADVAHCPRRFKWNTQNQNKLTDFLMCADVDVTTGVLDTTTLTPLSGGSTLSIEHGKVKLDSYSGADSLAVSMMDARFMVRGTVAGNISVDAGYKSEFLVYEGGAFTADSDITLSGFSPCGFDGAAGGSASITLAAGNTLTIKETQRIPVRLDQFLEVEVSTSGGISGAVSWNLAYRPVIGATLTGQSSGATGTVKRFVKKTSNAGASPYLDGWVVLEDVTGTFLASEVIQCERNWAGVQDLSEGIIGNTTGAAAIEYGQIREFRSGINGQAAPNVASSITLGGTLDISEAPSGHVVVDVDSISGSFGSVVGGTVTVTGTTVTVD